MDPYNIRRAGWIQQKLCPMFMRLLQCRKDRQEEKGEVENWFREFAIVSVRALHTAEVGHEPLKKFTMSQREEVASRHGAVSG